MSKIMSAIETLEVMQMPDGTTLIVTVHPSSLLRIEDAADKRAAYKEFGADLKAAAKKTANKAAKD